MSKTYHAAGATTTGSTEPFPTTDWASRTTRERCRIVAAARFQIADRLSTLVDRCRSEQRFNNIETLAAELIPLGDALHWIGKHGPATLADRKLGWLGRPLWLWGVRSLVRRVPLGRVLILGTWNYPLLLPGVQAAQALAAGNEVWLKPAIGSEGVTETLIECFSAAGVPPGAIVQLPSDTQSAQRALGDGVDLVVLTGAATTGRKVLEQTAQNITPTIMELSGCDAVIVLPGAKPSRVVHSIAFGLMFNSGATCIGPRRLFIEETIAGSLLPQILERLAHAEDVVVHPSARANTANLVELALNSGAIDVLGRFDAVKMRETGKTGPIVLTEVPEDHPILAADIFAPVISVRCYRELNEVVDQVNRCPYRLSVSMFGPVTESMQLAGRLSVGGVTINDMIAPTADPRLPFGGRGRSGFGVTRGPEGLLSMTTTHVISVRHGAVMPHLSPRKDGDEKVLSAAYRLRNARNWKEKLAALRDL